MSQDNGGEDQRPFEELAPFMISMTEHRDHCVMTIEIRLGVSMMQQFAKMLVGHAQSLTKRMVQSSPVIVVPPGSFDPKKGD